MQAAQLEDLQEAWPTWHVRCSPEGTWKATRIARSLTEDELNEGLAQTLMADSDLDLTDLLDGQAVIEARLDEAST